MIGYAIPTTPGGVVSIGDPNGPGAVAGYYLGNDDFIADIASRVAVLKSAVDTAKSQITESDDSTINLFVAPEFYFHGTSGTYIYDCDQSDPLIAIGELLSSTFNQAGYPNWMFVFGSVISTKTKDIQQVFTSASAISRNNVVKVLAKEWQESFGPLKGALFDMLINFIKICHSYPNCEVRNRSIIHQCSPIRCVLGTNRATRSSIKLIMDFPVIIAF